MKLETLTAKLTAEANRLEIVRPEVVERDGVISLRAGRIGLEGTSHVAFLGLASSGVRYLTAGLRRVAASL